MMDTYGDIARMRRRSARASRMAAWALLGGFVVVVASTAWLGWFGAGVSIVAFVWGWICAISAAEFTRINDDLGDRR